MEKIVCPKCGTEYKLKTAHKDRSVKWKCARCENILLHSVQQGKSYLIHDRETSSGVRFW